MRITECSVLLRPESEELRFLPEGPYWLGQNRVSWVAIQHGSGSTIGSINILDLNSLTNEHCPLPGRPGFAFPTDKPGTFVTGFERTVNLVDVATGDISLLVDGIESGVSNTIINDAVVFEGNLIFGCKELEFKTPKAGLYLWRRRDQSVVKLRDDQICSNGKAVVRADDGSLTLFDIDSVTKRITRCALDIDAGTVGEPQTVIDLTHDEVFPDGMILTPDHQSLIVALYHPGDPQSGSARQYNIRTGDLEAIWTCADSPRVTCPQLIKHEGRIRLLLTTADEGMSPEQRQRHPDAGCLFVGDTSFSSLGDQPQFPVL